MVIGYTFDLRTNKLTPQLAPNPSAGTEHQFAAYRVKGTRGGTVSIKSPLSVAEQAMFGDAE